LVVLTRPQGRNRPLAARLREAGLEALELPALAVSPLPIDASRFPLPQHYDLIVFVSANAALFYLEQLVAQGCTEWTASTMAATVGEASARPLREAGFIPSHCIVHPAADTQQDSEALWRLLEPRLGALRRVAIVRGERGREWLGECLERAGARVDRYAIYCRRPSEWTDGQRRALAAGLTPGRVVVGLFTSSESVDAFQQNLSASELQAFWHDARFVVIHERIARHLQARLRTAPGKIPAPMVKICPPADETIFQAVVSLAFL